MTFIASTRYYLYSSPWFMLFMVSNLLLGFTLLLLFEGALRPPIFDYVLITVIMLLGIGAAGMGFEVAAEVEE